MGDGATINNTSTGSFTIQNNQQIVNNYAPVPVFNNAGTLTKNTGTGTTAIGANFNNTGSGIVTVSTGTVAINGAGQSTTSKAIAVASGATLAFADPAFDNVYFIKSPISGAGSVIFANNNEIDLTGAYTVTGQTTIFGTNLVFNGAATIPKLLLEFGGSLGGTGSLTIMSAMTWGDGTCDESQLKVAGTLTIASTATLTLNNSSGFAIQGIDAYTLNIAGTMIWSGGSSLYSCSLVIAAGATLNIIGANGTNVLLDGATFTGAGIVDVDGGYLNVTANVSFPVLNLDAGYLEGTGTVTVTTSMQWDGAWMQDGGATTLAAGSHLVIDTTFVSLLLATRTLNISGTANWIGSNSLSMDYGSILNIKAGGSLSIQGNPTIFDDSSGPGAINNAGTITKSTSSRSMTITPAFNNTGTTTINTGTVVLKHVGTGKGSFSLSSGTTLDLNNANSATTGTIGAVNGSGTVDFTSGLTVVTGTLTAPGGVTVAGSGAAVLRGNANVGGLANAGSVTIGAGTTLALIGNYDQTGGTTYLQGGTITLPSGGSLTVGSGTIFVGIGTVSAPSNNFTFTNNGYLEVQGYSNNKVFGTLTIGGTLTESGSLYLSVGGSATNQFDRVVVNGTANLTGGDLEVGDANGYVPPVGTNLVVMTYASHIGSFGTFFISISGHGGTLHYIATNLTITTT